MNMPEAIVKYALNRSMGTKDFIPLDELIRNQFILTFSDTLYQGLYFGYNTPIMESIRPGSEQEIIVPDIKFTARNDGSCKLKFKLDVMRTLDPIGNTNETILTLLKNGSDYKTVTVNNGYGKDNWNTIPFESFGIINFKTGDTFSLRVKTINTNSRYAADVYLLDFNIYGDVKYGIFKV